MYKFFWGVNKSIEINNGEVGECFYIRRAGCVGSDEAVPIDSCSKPLK